MDMLTRPRDPDADLEMMDGGGVCVCVCVARWKGWVRGSRWVDVERRDATGTPEGSTVGRWGCCGCIAVAVSRDERTGLCRSRWKSQWHAHHRNAADHPLSAPAFQPNAIRGICLPQQLCVRPSCCVPRRRPSPWCANQGWKARHRRARRQHAHGLRPRCRPAWPWCVVVYVCGLPAALPGVGLGDPDVGPPPRRFSTAGWGGSRCERISTPQVQIPLCWCGVGVGGSLWLCMPLCWLRCSFFP